MYMELSQRDNIAILNRLTLNFQGSVSEEDALYNVLRDCGCLFIFRKIINKMGIKDITEVKKDTDRVFLVEFSKTKEAKDAINIIEKNQYKIARSQYDVTIEQHKNRLKFIIEGDD